MYNHLQGLFLFQTCIKNIITNYIISAANSTNYIVFIFISISTWVILDLTITTLVHVVTLKLN